MIDPLGFALENFDAIGGWRTIDESGKPVDASGTTVSGATGRRARRPARAAARAARAVSAHGHREAAGLRARPPARVLRSAGRAQDRPRRGGAATIAGRRSFSASCKSPHVSDAGIGNDRELSHDFPHREIVAAAHGAARARRDAGAAVPRCDDAGVRRGRARPRSRRTGSRRSTCRTAWRWSTGRRRARARAFELSPILEPLAPFRNQMLVLSGLKANWNYIHAGASGSFLTGTTRGGRNEVEIIADVSMDQLLARHFASETQVASLELVDGRPGQRRRLHRQPELRLHAHDLVAQPDAAAADGVQPARGVREAVRRQRQHRPRRRARRGCGSTRAFSTRSPRSSRASSRSSGRRIRRRSTSTPRRFATSSAASRRPRSSATSSCRRWSSRRACRRCSRITWR